MSREAQKANAKASPIGLGTLRSGGGRANWLIRENDVMKIHQKTPELENRDSGPEQVFLPESVTERSSGLEFRRNLQPRQGAMRLVSVHRPTRRIVPLFH